MKGPRLFSYLIIGTGRNVTLFVRRSTRKGARILQRQVYFLKISIDDMLNHLVYSLQWIELVSSRFRYYSFLPVPIGSHSSAPTFQLRCIWPTYGNPRIRNAASVYIKIHVPLQILRHMTGVIRYVWDDDQDPRSFLITMEPCQRSRKVTSSQSLNGVELAVGISHLTQLSLLVTFSVTIQHPFICTFLIPLTAYVRKVTGNS